MILLPRFDDSTHCHAFVPARLSQSFFQLGHYRRVLPYRLITGRGDTTIHFILGRWLLQTNKQILQQSAYRSEWFLVLGFNRTQGNLTCGSNFTSFEILGGSKLLVPQHCELLSHQFNIFPLSQVTIHYISLILICSGPWLLDC